MRANLFQCKVVTAVVIAVSFLLVSPLNADCPHCYMLAKVQLRMKSGEERTGFMPIYGWYHAGSRINENVDLKGILTVEDQDTLYFVEKYYSFGDAGSMVAEEDIEEIRWGTIGHMVFLKWHRNFGGAGPLHSLPQKTIQRLKNAEIMQVERIIESCSDEIFVNLNPDISKKEFQLLIRFCPSNEHRARIDEFGRLSWLMQYPQYYERTHNTMLTKETVVDSIQISLDYARKQLEELSEPFSNTFIRDYLTQIKIKYEKRIDFYGAILAFLNDGSETRINEFVSAQIHDDELKLKIETFVDHSRSRELEANDIKHIWDLVSGMLSLNGKTKVSFNEVLKETDIIVYRWSWD